MAHHYTYTERLEPRRKPVYLEKGSVVHDLLEYEAKKLDWEARLEEIEAKRGAFFEQEREYYGDIIGDSRKIVRRYVKRWKDEVLEYILCEPDLEPIYFTHLMIEGVRKNIWLVVKPDGLVKDSTGDLWILERKTVSNKFASLEHRVFDLQTSLYIWALEKMGYKNIRGVLWDEVRAKTPRRPDVLKNGSLSKRKSIDTDWGTYLRAIKKHGLDPKNYEDMKSAINADPDKFFRRVPLRANPSVVKMIVKEAQATAKVIQMGLTPVMELGYGCRSCFYEKICRAKLTGSDVDFVKKTEFKLKEKR